MEVDHQLITNGVNPDRVWMSLTREAQLEKAEVTFAPLSRSSDDPIHNREEKRPLSAGQEE